MRKSDYELFIQRFDPMLNNICPSGGQYMFETYDKEWEFVKCFKPEYVWTLVDTDNNKTYALPGFHIVNRLGYLVCNKPWKETDRDYLWF